MDKHALYQQAVQYPPGDISWMCKFYTKYIGLKVTHQLGLAVQVSQTVCMREFELLQPCMHFCAATQVSSHAQLHLASSHLKLYPAPSRVLSCPQYVVQQTVHVCYMLMHVYACMQAPCHLREDFCGTAYLSATWCRQNVCRTATGEPLRFFQVIMAQPALRLLYKAEEISAACTAASGCSSCIVLLRGYIRGIHRPRLWLHACCMRCIHKPSWHVIECCSMHCRVLLLWLWLWLHVLVAYVPVLQAVAAAARPPM